MVEAPARSSPFTAISDADHSAFRRDGYLIVRGALDAVLRTRAETAVDALYARAAREGELGAYGSMRLPGGVGHSAVFAELLDLPAVFPHIWGHLGWNIAVDRSHVEVDPPVPVRTAPAWTWHQDGRPRDAEPRPMLAMTAGYVLSGGYERGRGAMLVIPGSHLGATLTRPEPDADGEYPTPPGAVAIPAAPGDAFVLDRRLWRSRPENRSAVTRKMIFLGYAYRWIRGRDDAPAGPYMEGLSPLRRQLLGHDEESTGFFGITAEPSAAADDIPLRAELKKRGLLEGGPR